MTMKWMFSLLSCLFLGLLNGHAQQRWVVAQDGSGDFKTVQMALDAIKEGNNDPVEVFVKKGFTAK